MGAEGVIPRFITFEGGEGAGKSTQVARLVEFLTTKGISVVRTREPGGSAGAEEIRHLLVNGGTDRWDGITEVLLHSAARRDHMVKTVWPALEAGSWVICDRFFDSTLAYQGWGHGIDVTQIRQAIQVSIGNFRPDRTLILDMPVEQGLARAASRGDAGQDRYERMGAAFHQRLRQGFLDIAADEPGRCRVIDALGSIEAIHAQVVDAVQDLL